MGSHRRGFKPLKAETLATERRALLHHGARSAEVEQRSSTLAFPTDPAIAVQEAKPDGRLSCGSLAEPEVTRLARNDAVLRQC